jgi:hypothetical protein
MPQWRGTMPQLSTIRLAIDQQLGYIVFMSAKLLQKILDSTGKTSSHVFVDTGVSVTTVERYLKGETKGSRLVRRVLEEWIAKHSKSSGSPTAA